MVRRHSDQLRVVPVSEGRSLEELLVATRSRIGVSLNHIELLTVAAPFCSPLLELVRDDLREALDAAQEAERLERKLVRLLVGPTLQSVSSPPPPQEADAE
jgi:hypothetical protein